MKVMTIVGTRPELIKLSRVIYELKKNLIHVLVHTGQNFDKELNDIFFKELQINKPNYYLNAAGKTAIQTISKVLEKSEKVILKEKPDAVLVYGDTNSCMAAIVAKRHKIPVFHMEAGNRSFDERVPEEINRRIIDHISDINFTLTEHARRYLINEGIRAETIIKTGSCMEEVLNFYMPKINDSKILDNLKLKENKFFLVSVHREENVDSEERLRLLLGSLNKLVKKYKTPIIFSVHPRTRKKISNIKNLQLDKKIHLMKPFGFFDYIKLQMNAKCTLSDSGTISEEGSLLNLPAVMLRQSHERPEGMDEATVVMSDLNIKEILQSIKVVLAHSNKLKPNLRNVHDYNGGNVSLKIVRLILSYTSYVQRTVWRNH